MLKIKAISFLHIYFTHDVLKWKYPVCCFLDIMLHWTHFDLRLSLNILSAKEQVCSFSQDVVILSGEMDMMNIAVRKMVNWNPILHITLLYLHFKQDLCDPNYVKVVFRPNCSSFSPSQILGRLLASYTPLITRNDSASTDSGSPSPLLSSLLSHSYNHTDLQTLALWALKLICCNPDWAYIKFWFTVSSFVHLFQL